MCLNKKADSLGAFMCFLSWVFGSLLAEELWYSLAWKVQACDICGDIGVVDALLICPKCKTSCEHIYCRKIFNQNAIDDWSCDSCIVATHSTPDSKHQRGEKRVMKGKVKRISVDEAIMLSSGSMRRTTPVGTTKKGSFSPLRIEDPVCSSVPVKSTKKSVPLPGNKQNNSAIRHRSLVAHAVPKGMKNIQALRKELIQMAQPNSIMAPAETKDANMIKESGIPGEAINADVPVNQKIKRADILEQQFLRPINSGNQVASKVSDVQNCKLKNIGSIAKKGSRSPARDSSWKGRFEIDFLGDINSGFEARPCSRGLRIVFDFSKTMPKVLKFKLIHQKEGCRSLFQDDSPDEDDIGLYFNSGEKRSSDYDLILTFIEANDSAIRCDLGGVELYVFSSKILSGDYQKLDGQYFLWGVFHKIKKQKDVSELYKERPVLQPLDSSQNDDDDYSVEMEIDMIAGKEVGKVDIAVPSASSFGAYSSLEHVSSNPFQVIKKEPRLDCPPGFHSRAS